MFNKYKTDFYIFGILIISGFCWLLYAWNPNNIGQTLLSGSEVICVDGGSGKYGGVHASLSLNGQQYSIKGKFDSPNDCQNFALSLVGKKVEGNYLKVNNIILDLFIDNKPYYERSLILAILACLFLAVVAWSLIRNPLMWLLRKFA